MKILVRKGTYILLQIYFFSLQYLPVNINIKDIDRLDFPIYKASEK